jgi:hypothetical protein
MRSTKRMHFLARFDLMNRNFMDSFFVFAPNAANCMHSLNLVLELCIVQLKALNRQMFASREESNAKLSAFEARMAEVFHLCIYKFSLPLFPLIVRIQQYCSYFSLPLFLSTVIQEHMELARVRGALDDSQSQNEQVGHDNFHSRIFCLSVHR